MTVNKMKLVIIDEQQFFRKGLNRAFQEKGIFDVVVSSDDFSVVPHVLKAYHIDMLLIHVAVFRRHKGELKRILDHDQTIKVIIMADKNEENIVAEAVALGIDGYLLKDMGVDTFIEALQLVNNGKTYIHPIVTDRLIEEYRKLSEKYPTYKRGALPVERPLHLYTRRECEVLQLLAHGKSNRSIAESLSISEKTVKNHVSSLFKKMKVNDRTQAVVTAIRNQWVNI